MAAKHERALSSSESDPPPVGYKEKKIRQLRSGVKRTQEPSLAFFSVLFSFCGFGAQRSDDNGTRLSLDSGTRRVVYNGDDGMMK